MAGSSPNKQLSAPGVGKGGARSCCSWHPLQNIPVEDGQNRFQTFAMDDDDLSETDSEVEVAVSNKRATPVLPTRAEVEAHEDAGHVQYRSWCGACRRGRGRATPHKHQSEDQKDDEQIPTVSLDYGFFSKEKATDKGTLAKKDDSGRSLPVMIVKDRRSKAIASVPVPAKGIEHPYPAKKLLKILDLLGYKRVLMKTDQEPSIVALVKAVKDGWSGEILPEGSPKGQSQSNGEIERAVESVQGLARTIKDDIEQKANIKLKPTSPLLAWLVEHAGNLYTILHKGKDGHTAWHRLRGKPWRQALQRFGECVEFRQKTRNKLQNKYRPGVYLGTILHTTEK
jgi:thiol-disulfide isomerase/thioredoxin